MGHVKIDTYIIVKCMQLDTNKVHIFSREYDLRNIYVYILYIHICIGIYTL